VFALKGIISSSPLQAAGLSNGVKLLEQSKKERKHSSFFCCIATLNVLFLIKDLFSAGLEKLGRDISGKAALK